ncbi:MAG: hypothetical protein RL017_46 [Pseudomonadota bacterium]
MSHKNKIIFVLVTAIAIFQCNAEQTGDQFKEKVLYNLQGGSGGAYIYSGLISATDGNFYGTTDSGGEYGFGTIFNLTPHGKQQVLYSFKGANDGMNPDASLVQGADGDLYGTTTGGGSSSFCDGGCGTVFKITPQGAKTILYNFQGGSDGTVPDAGLIQGQDGNFYGATTTGGDVNCNDGLGCGTIFKITPQGQETVLYSFHWKTDGAFPLSTLIYGNDGNLYGTTEWGGNKNLGNVFKITTQGQETVLYSFQIGGDGSNPEGSLVQDSDGNLYGTTVTGGDSGNGVVFKITPQGQETILHKFEQNQTDGVSPRSGLIQGMDGAFYGTTFGGGKDNSGVVFKITPQGQETILHTFKENQIDVQYPHAALTQDSKGNLYGTSFGGGKYGFGTIYKIKDMSQN